MQFLIVMNMVHVIFILAVRPYDEYRNREGNVGVLVNGAFTQVVLGVLVAMMLVFASVEGREKVVSG